MFISVFPKEKVAENVQSMTEFYNQQVGKDAFAEDEKRISWTNSKMI